MQTPQDPLEKDMEISANLKNRTTIKESSKKI